MDRGKKFLLCILAAGFGLLLYGMEIGLKVDPAVFAVETEYQILVTTRTPSLIRIQIGDRFYSDHINGVRPTEKSVHRFHIPMEELNKAGKYTVFCRPVPQRLPYLHKTTPEKENSKTYTFRKLPEKNIRIGAIADVHNHLEKAVETLQAAGEMDLLILNGDLIDTASSLKQMEYPCLIAGRVTRGRIPVIYARGNHELRGPFAEKVHEYVPNVNGRMYYQIQLGSLWILVLDAGEDKQDSNPAYGFTIDCTNFRREVLEFIKKTAAQGEFQKPQFKHKLIVCHTPFPRYMVKTPKEETKTRFAIFHEWCQVLKSSIRPDLIMSGHIHRSGVLNGPDFPCPVLLGSRSRNTPEGYRFFHCSITELLEDKAQVRMIDDQKQVKKEYTIPFQR